MGFCDLYCMLHASPLIAFGLAAQAIRMACIFTAKVSATLHAAQCLESS